MQDVVNNICDDEDIKAVSFVGSNTVSESSILSVYLSVAQFFQYAVLYIRRMLTNRSCLQRFSLTF